METAFTPIASLAGGALIGLAAVLLMLFEGRIAGVSGILARLLPPLDRLFPRRLAFVAGLFAAPFAVALATGAAAPFHLEAGTGTLVLGGLLVGFGTVIGAGCTSGHGICGLSLLSPRSMVAVPVFMATAAATVFVVRHLA